jgi:predicted RNase H-like nuclease (RuvC/YqgF family)
LIAQDVQKVMEEVVDKGADPANTLGVNYTEIIPVLIKGIQEQESQIIFVKQENADLKKTNNDLLQRIKLLESKVEQIESSLPGNISK